MWWQATGSRCRPKAQGPLWAMPSCSMPGLLQACPCSPLPSLELCSQCPSPSLTRSGCQILICFWHLTLGLILWRFCGAFFSSLHLQTCLSVGLGVSKKVGSTCHAAYICSCPVDCNDLDMYMRCARWMQSAIHIVLTAAVILADCNFSRAGESKHSREQFRCRLRSDC